MNDQPVVSFALQRAKPIRGPGISEPPKMVQEPPARELRRRSGAKQTAPASSHPTPPDPDMIPSRVANGDGPTTGGGAPLMHQPATKLEPQNDQVAIPIGDVLALAKVPKAAEVIALFDQMDFAEGRMTLHMVHKLWPHLFG